MDESNRLTVLLVDDAISFHSMIEMFLRQSPVQKYKLISVVSAEDMFTTLQTDKTIDVVLLDISLPGQNGLSACKNIHASNPELPIIIITAKLDSSLIAKAQEVGAVGFLSKPFDGASLRSRLFHATEHHSQVTA